MLNASHTNPVHQRMHRVSISYNCKHFKERGPKFDISKECDILFIQEHCLHKSELTQMCKLGDGMAITSKSSMDECIARDGHPYGGCAIMWKLIYIYI